MNRKVPGLAPLILLTVLAAIGCEEDENAQVAKVATEAAKQQEVAEHYKDRPKDRVFYAYTDRLTYRTLNQK